MKASGLKTSKLMRSPFTRLRRLSLSLPCFFAAALDAQQVDVYARPLQVEPSRDFDPVAVEFHRVAEEERRRILYHGTDWETHRT